MGDPGAGEAQLPGGVGEVVVLAGADPLVDSVGEGEKAGDA